MVKYLRMESYDSFINILQGYFTGTEADVGLSQCKLSNPEQYIDCFLTNIKQVLIVYTVVGMHSTWYCA